MVTIDLTRVNRISPYSLVASNRSLFYELITDTGIDYTIGFTPNGILSDVLSYEFVIVNRSQRKSPRDVKLRQSIIALIQEFFRQRKAVLIYICETGDNRQSQRFRLFDSWRRASGQERFVSLSMNLTDEEGIPNYAAIITRKDNPDLPFISKQFRVMEELLREKPE